MIMPLRGAGLMAAGAWPAQRAVRPNCAVQTDATASIKIFASDQRGRGSRTSSSSRNFLVERFDPQSPVPQGLAATHRVRTVSSTWRHRVSATAGSSGTVPLGRCPSECAQAHRGSPRRALPTSRAPRSDPQPPKRPQSPSIPANDSSTTVRIFSVRARRATRRQKVIRAHVEAIRNGNAHTTRDRHNRHRRRLGCIWGTFNPSRRHSRSVLSV